jgi:hypothetical protein
MSRARIFAVFILVDLVIVAGVVWCFFHRIPARQFFVPAIVLFVANGVWLIWATIRNTPQRP